MRPAGSGGSIYGRSCATFDDNVWIEYVVPTRSSVTVAGSVAYARNSSRVRGSNPSARERGGASLRRADARPDAGDGSHPMLHAQYSLPPGSAESTGFGKLVLGFSRADWPKR